MLLVLCWRVRIPEPCNMNGYDIFKYKGPFAPGGYHNQNRQQPPICIYLRCWACICAIDCVWLQCLFAFAIIIFTTLAYVCLFDQSLSVCVKVAIRLRCISFWTYIHPWELKLKKLQFSETQNRRLFNSCAKIAQLSSVPYFFTRLSFQGIFNSRYIIIIIVIIITIIITIITIYIYIHIYIYVILLDYYIATFSCLYFDVFCGFQNLSHQVWRPGCLTTSFRGISAFAVSPPAHCMVRDAMEGAAQISATSAAVPAFTTRKAGPEGFSSFLPSTSKAKYASID